MQIANIILLGLVILVYASTRSPEKTKLSRFRHLKGWQKIFGVVAVILTLLIILNPEFLALGLIGDTAFFDMLVLAMSLQLHVITSWAYHTVVGVLSRGVRWVGIPSPGLRYLLAVLTPAIGAAVTIFQRAVHRILS
jgi:uncharacterized membrane protein YkgB